MVSKWIYGIIISSVVSLVSLQAYADTPKETGLTSNVGAAVEPTPTSSTITTKPDGATFMEENKHKPDVVTLPSGLQYKIVKPGDSNAKKAGKNDVVTVDYEGTLVNGQVFDSSYKRGQPASFPVSGVIAGWQEAIPLMNPGAEWMLYIPPQLAYGEKGAGALIGPNQTLIFKVHLIKVQ